MKFIKHPVDYYVDRIQRGDYFALVGYSDAEWFSIIKYDIGKATGLGQILDENTGNRLLDVLVRRHRDPRFLFASPDCLGEWEDMVRAGITEKIDLVLDQNGVDVVFYERDRILDDLARDAGLNPWIYQFQKMPVAMVGNKYLREINFLNCEYFVEISSPNFHLREGGIERVAQSLVNYGRPAAYLISAGMSAALIIDQIYDRIPNSFFIDCGSIWDAFVGIGGQREWRRKLYKNPEAYRRWINANLQPGA